MPSTIRLHRVLAAKPEKIYRAFVEADALAQWLPPNGLTCNVHDFEPNEGGKRRLSFRNFTNGHVHGFGGEFVQLTPHAQIRYVDRIDDLPGDISVTVSLTAVSIGTELHIVQDGVPDPIPPEACYHGWHQSLAKLAVLAEPNIP